MSECYKRRAIDVTLAAKLTLTYGKYHMAMLNRQITQTVYSLDARGGGGIQEIEKQQ